MTGLYSTSSAFDAVNQYFDKKATTPPFTALSESYKNIFLNSKLNLSDQDYILSAIQKLEEYLPSNFCEKRDCDPTYDKILLLVTRYFSNSMQAFYKNQEDIDVLNRIEKLSAKNQNRYKLCDSLAKIYDLTFPSKTCLSDGICVIIVNKEKKSNLFGDINILLSHITWSKNYETTNCLGPLYEAKTQKDCIKNIERKYHSLKSELEYIEKCAKACSDNPNYITDDKIKKVPPSAETRPINRAYFLHALAKITNATTSIYRDFLPDLQQQFSNEENVAIL